MNIIRGMVIGTTDLIPGVSGGTMAIILGIYRELIAAINGLFSKEWKKHVMYLLPVGIGIGVALLSVSRLIDWVLANYPAPLFYFFIGLILGIVPFLLKTVNYKQTFTKKHFVLLLIAALVVASTVFRGDPAEAQVSELTFLDYIVFFSAGILASSAMILPGISGALVFLLLGVYESVIHAVSTLNIPVMIAIALGIFVGIIVTSKIINYLLTHFRTSTFAVMIGLVIGSIVVIFPGIPQSAMLIFVSIFAIVSGLAVAVILGRVDHSQDA